MKYTGRILGLAFCLFAAPFNSAVSADEQKIEEGAVVTLTGTLKKGVMAIGGETTGWVLEYQTREGMGTIQVDPTRLELGKIPEGNVSVKGDIVERSYLQSGPTLVLRALKIKSKRGKGA